MPIPFPYTCYSRDPRYQTLHGKPCRVIDSRQRATHQRVMIEFETGERATVHTAAIRRRKTTTPRLSQSRKGRNSPLRRSERHI